MAKRRERLDQVLVQRHLATCLAQARADIMAGLVKVDGRRVDKAGTLVDVRSEVVVAPAGLPYVSRGGLKLAKALAEFHIDLAGRVVADIGASTGGFTDCALQHGAARVFAVDVGYGQLAWSLRNDPRVVVRERTNVRYVTPQDLGQQVDVATIDVSFISLVKVLPTVTALLAPHGEVIALVKPQFEAPREDVGARGVVSDPAVQRQVLTCVLTAARGLSLVPAGLTFSPIRGPEGNIEYLLWLRRGADATATPIDVDAVVAEAQAFF